MSEVPNAGGGGGRSRLIAGTVFVLLLLVGGVWVFATATSRPGGTVETAAPTGTSRESESVCGLSGFETSSSLSSAPSAEWTLVGTVAAPSTSAGPGTVDGAGFRSCFAQTAEGALLAAVNYVALSSDPRLQPDLWRLLEPGVVRDRVRDAYGDATGVPSSTRMQVAGFKVLQYDGASAVIDVAWQITGSQSGLVSMPIELVWLEGDWLVATTDAGLPYAPTALQSLGGYIPFSGA